MNAWAVLRASCSARERSVLSWFYGGFAVLAAVIAATLPKPDPRLPLLVMGLPTLFAWGGWFARLLLLQRQARCALVPGLGAVVASALALAAAVTIVLPALAAAAWGLPWLPVLSVLVALAAAAVLAMLLPRGMVAMIAFAPMALQWSGASRLVPFGDAPPLVPLLAAAMVLVCAWRWRAVLRGDAGRGGDWAQPLVLAIGERGSWWRASSWSDPHAQQAATPRWMQPGRWSAGAGPARPVRAMQAWLGSPFAPLSPMQRLVQFGGWAAIAVLGWRGVANGEKAAVDALFPVLMIVAGALLVVAPVFRLQAFKQAANGEMAELALLPGWGDAAAARRVVLAAIATPLALLLASFAIAVIGIAAWLHEDALRLAVLLAALVALATTAAAGCLRALSGVAFEALGKWGCVLGGFLLCILTTAAFQRPLSEAAPLVSLSAWSTLAIGSGWTLRAAWKRWHAQPHGFVAPAQ